MTRYHYGVDRSIKNKINGSSLSIVIFLVLVTVFMFALANISESTTDRQQEALENAITRSIVNCYCVEGTYPPSLSYLSDHYGLTYDKELFFVDYQAIGSNIFPDVTIIRKEK